MAKRTWEMCIDPCADGCCELVADLEKHDPDYLEDSEMLGLLKNEVVVTPIGIPLRVMTSAGERHHPVFAHHPGLQPIHALNYPTKVFRDRRVRRTT